MAYTAGGRQRSTIFEEAVGNETWHQALQEELVAAKWRSSVQVLKNRRLAFLHKALPREKLEEFRIKLDIINFELRGSVKN